MKIETEEVTTKKGYLECTYIKRHMSSFSRQANFSNARLHDPTVAVHLCVHINVKEKNIYLIIFIPSTCRRSL